MSQGPIEFASDPVRDEKGPTEFGGTAGLVQGGEHLGAGAGAGLTGSEKRGMIVRGRAVEEVDVVTGRVGVDEAASAVDPVTGLEVGPDVVSDGSTVPPVDAPPRTGDARSATL